METGGETVRRLAIVATATLALGVSPAAPVSGQEPLGFLQPLIAFLSSQTGTDLEADLTRVPGPGAVVPDPANDYEHITGESPRRRPEYVDIREGTIFEIDPGLTEFFGNTNRAALWSPTGPREIVPPEHPSFFTYTTNLPKDGAQYAGGALLFRIHLREAPPPRPDATCDYTVWAHDASRDAVFQNLPQFPGDPATGTNLAFGARLTPESGAVPVAFALALDDQGTFQPTDTDVRAFVIGEDVGLLVPADRVGSLSSVNYHAVCWDGSAIDPASSGADQTGLSPVTLSDIGAIVIMETPIMATPTVEATTSTNPASPTTAPQQSGEDTDAGAAAWIPAAAASALLAAIGYWALSRRRNPEERALAAWKRAEQLVSTAEVAAEPLVLACLDFRSVLEELEHERADLCRVWPPACLDEDDDARATTADDQHFRRMALGELWVDYREGEIGAEQVETRWREVNTPDFQARMRETDQAYRETLAQLDAEIAIAKAEMELACTLASSAVTRAEEARQAVLVARRAYVETLESAPAPPAASWLLEECDHRADQRLAPEGPAEHMRVNVGFMISVGRFVGRERNLERGERLVLELEGLLNELKLVSRVNRARRGGAHTGWSGREYEPGVYWVTSSGIRRGESEERLYSADEAAQPASVTGEEADLTDLPTTIGDHASSKITGWMTGFDTLTMQRTFFHQVITSRPYATWECQEGAWVRREQVWRVEVGEPERNRGEIRWFSVETPGRRAQFETEVNRLAWVATGVVTRDLRRLLRWRAGHIPAT